MEQIMKAKQISTFISAAMIAGALAVAGCAQPSETFTIDRTTVNGLPSIASTASVTGTVKIEAVDYDNRSVALEGPDGKSEIFKVSPEVRNFDQIKQGDVVKVQYMQTIDVNVRKVGQPLSTAEVASVATAPLGDKPGVVAARTVQTLANVQAIDYQARTVTLVGMGDKPVTFHVHKDLASFDNVVEGDQVVFTYTEAVSIDVTK
jgi:Cu/Ag efflux protein CusF